MSDITIENVECHNPLCDKTCWFYDDDETGVHLCYGVPSSIDVLSRPTDDFETAVNDYMFLFRQSNRGIAEESICEVKDFFETDHTPKETLK